MNDLYFLYFVSEIKKKMVEYIEIKLKENGINDLVPAYSNLITTLYINDGQMKMNDIKKIICKDKSTITILVNNLIKKGYLKKEKCDSDKRIINILLTDKALEHKSAFENIFQDLKDVSFKNFTEEEKEIFLSLFLKVKNNINSELLKQK